MKIIKRGVLPEDIIWQGKCCRCKTIAEEKQSELEVVHDRDGSFAWHICPVCKTGPYGGILFHPKN